MTSTNGDPLPPVRSYKAETAFSVRALTIALDVLARIEPRHQAAAWSKSDRSPVTLADLAVQAAVAGWLERALPRERLIAEEESARLRQSGEALQAVIDHVSPTLPGAAAQDVLRWIDRGAGEAGERYWLLDPVDGTRGFLRRGQYVTALALVESGRVVLGAIGCPRLTPSLLETRDGPGCLAVSVRGEGTWLAGLGSRQWKRLSVSGESDPVRARILRSVEPAHTDLRKLESIAQALAVSRPSARMDSQAKYVLLAAGEADLIIRLISPSRPGYVEKAWDIAAGAILVQEAGGRVTDLRGAELDFRAGRTMAHNLGVVASNGLLHAEALRAIRAAGADRRPVEH